MSKRIAVAGAGHGGLVAAYYLACAGYDVTVYEKKAAGTLGYDQSDSVHLDGKVNDPQRIDYTKRYLRSYYRAAQEGVPLAGYIHWSFMDNFEWAEGFDLRFGLVYVDYQTQKRTPKESAYWYRDVIASNGELIWE